MVCPGKTRGEWAATARHTKRFGRVAAVAAAGALAGCSGGESTEPPDVETPQGASEFDSTVEYDSEAGELGVTDASGVELSPDAVCVRGDGVDSTGSWSDLDGATTDGDEDMVARFDAVTVGASSDCDIQVV